MPSPQDPVDTAAPQGAALHEAKLALRRQVLAGRDAMAPVDRTTAAQAIIARIIALPSFATSRTVLLTLAFRTEWNTLPLVRAALASGKTVAIPRVNLATRMLDLHALADPDHDVGAGHQGIPEPLPHCPTLPPGTLDWVLVPGVAFDSAGRRLGYGGGFYDRLLPLVPRGAMRVAGAFDMQIVHRVPAAPHDHGVDAIVTESRTIEIAR